MNHDPAKRPTATELLKSELLPPPQMEESELHEVLHHTLANVDGKAYRTMMGQIFAQRISPAIDYTYDSDILRGFPAPPPLSPFSPPDLDRRVDSPALSGRGSRPSGRTSG